MAYKSRGSYPFHLRVFHVKIIVSLWLIYCCLIAFVVLVSLIVEPILTHKEGNVIFRIIVFGSLSKQSGIRAWLIEVFFFFFLCDKMDVG